MKTIKEIVLNYFDRTEENVFSRSRKADLVFIRHIYFYFCRKYLKIGYKYIGQSKWMNHNHASVIHGVRKINGFLDVNDKEVQAVVNNINEIILRAIHNSEIIEQQNCKTEEEKMQVWELEFDTKKQNFIKKVIKTENYIELKSIISNGY